MFEEQVLGVIELGALRPFSEVNQAFLDQLADTIGVVINTIQANMGRKSRTQRTGAGLPSPR